MDFLRDATSPEPSFASRSRKAIDVFAAFAYANRSLTWHRTLQCAAPGCQWLLHAGDRFGSERLDNARPFLHVGKDTERFVNILPGGPLRQCLRHHLLGAWLATANNDYGDRYQILKIAF